MTDLETIELVAREPGCIELLAIADPRPELFVEVAHAAWDTSTGVTYGDRWVYVSDGCQEVAVRGEHLDALIGALQRAKAELGVSA